TYNFNGQSMATAGAYTSTLTSVTGCDSVVTLNLTVNSILTSSIDAQICSGSTYNFNGQSLTTAGAYTSTLTSVTGCDSVVTLNLTVNSILTSSIDAQICSGSTYNFNGQSLTTAGAYTSTLTSVTGCDSVVTLNLTVNSILTSSIDAQICSGSTYNFNGQSLTTAGAYTSTLTSVTGCDSVVTLNLTVNSILTSSIDAQICSGSTYNFNGQSLTTAGAYTSTLTSVTGCDSVVTLNLTVNSILTSSIDAQICSGSTYNFNGQSLTTAGAYTSTLTSANGCDSVITLNLTVNSILTSSIDAQICSGSTYNFNDRSLNTAGTYTSTLTSVSGCDSVITLNLTVNSILTSSIDAQICSGSSYNFNGQSLTTAGTYTSTLTCASGCDSVITLNLTVNSILTSSIDAQICSGSTY